MTAGSDLWRRYYRPVELAASITLAAILALCLVLPCPTSDLYGMLMLVRLVAAYLLAFFHWALPRFGEHAWVNPPAMVINVSIIGAADRILGR